MVDPYSAVKAELRAVLITVMPLWWIHLFHWWENSFIALHLYILYIQVFIVPPTMEKKSLFNTDATAASKGQSSAAPGLQHHTSFLL